MIVQINVKDIPEIPGLATMVERLTEYPVLLLKVRDYVNSNTSLRTAYMVHLYWQGMTAVDAMSVADKVAFHKVDGFEFEGNTYTVS
jgi:hypothetical protein